MLCDVEKNTSMFLRKVIIFMFALYSNTTYSQRDIFTINGIVTDKDSESRLVGVSITGVNGNCGTLSNKNGEFMLNVPATVPPDSLQFSMLGYQTKIIAINEKLSRSTVIISLRPTAIVLSDVVISAINPVDIIKDAIAKIPDNYISRGHIQQGFYRTATKKGTEYIQISEAAFDIFNYGYGKDRLPQLKLAKNRMLKDEKESHGIDLGLKPRNLFAYDPLNDIANNPVLNKEGLRKHRFVLRDVVNYKGKEAYEITFDQKADQKEALYKGTIYILKEDLTIAAIKYGLSPKGIKYARYGDMATRALMKLVGLSVQIKRDDLQVTYRSSGGKWVLSEVKNNTVLQLKSDRKHYDFDANVTVDYITTGIDTANKTPFPDDLSLGNSKFIEYQETQPDSIFWKEFNVILSDFPVEPILQKIRAANEMNDLKARAQKYLHKLPRKNAANVDSIITYYSRNGQFNGTVLVLHQGEIMLDKSYGMANKEKEIIASRNTAYRLGSLSKPFTAIIIEQLANEGKLDLNAPIGRYLPDYAHPGITPAQLLSHTSGLPNCTNNPNYLSVLTSEHLPLKEVVRRFCSDTLEFEPGSRFAYSNSGYILLAHLAEAIEAEDFGRILRDRIFIPLQMNNTYLGWRMDDTTAATGYLYEQKERAYPVTNLAGSGGITSTTSDLLKFNNGLLTNILLPDSVVQTMYRPRAEYADWNADYGYGWMIDKAQFTASKKSRIIYHPGTDMAFYSMFAKKDETQTLVILLSNTGDFPRFDIIDLVFSVLGD